MIIVLGMKMGQNKLEISRRLDLTILHHSETNIQFLLYLRFIIIGRSSTGRITLLFFLALRLNFYQAVRIGALVYEFFHQVYNCQFWDCLY